MKNNSESPASICRPFECDGIKFTIRITYPRRYEGTSKPCEGKVTPVPSPDFVSPQKQDSKSPQKSDSLKKPIATLRGVNEEDVWNRREFVARKLMVRYPELAESKAPENPDGGLLLADVAREYAEPFFASNRRRWGANTESGYRHQFDILVGEMKDIYLSELTAETYKVLQIRICQQALLGSRDPGRASSWKYGDAPASSARKRLYLLYSFLLFLKNEEGLSFPVRPTRYNCTTPRQEQLLERTDYVRSLPDEPLRRACATSQFLNLAGVLLDAGLRISEAAGLLFSSVRTIETSQGRMYYLEITGQLSKNGIRSERTKTDASYRTVPLSPQLGEALLQHREEMEKLHGDLSLRLMCGISDGNTFSDDPAVANSWRDGAADMITEFLRSEEIQDLLTKARPFTFNLAAQNESQKSMATAHAFRRACCTRQYTRSCEDTDTIYRYMGHADKTLAWAPSGPFGLTDDELRKMCLRQYVSCTPFHPELPLRYAADGEIHTSEVPACQINLVIPAGFDFTLLVKNTEPGNVTRISGDDVQPAGQR